jgi:1-acyl-sn-glycerol-3-phosphate acyltransferase
MLAAMPDPTQTSGPWEPGPGGVHGGAATERPGGPRPEAPASGLGSALATVGGNGFLLVGTAILAVCTVLTGWIPLPRGGRLFFFWARWWSRLLLRFSGVRWRAEHAAPLARGQAYVFLANHQSLFDIPVLLASLPVPARFMAKRELFRIPIFGWALRVGGFIPVDRGAGRGARESFRAATTLLRGGASVLVFPEETRSPDGRLLPFKRGGFLLAQQAGLPVVPVGIQGTLGVRQRKSFRIHPGRALVRYGAPVPAAAPGKRGGAELLATVRRRIAALAEVEDPFGVPPAGVAEPDGMLDA